jgi:hypothetical protein
LLTTSHENPKEGESIIFKIFNISRSTLICFNKEFASWRIFKSVFTRDSGLFLAKSTISRSWSSVQTILTDCLDQTELVKRLRVKPSTLWVYAILFTFRSDMYGPYFKFEILRSCLNWMIHEFELSLIIDWNIDFKMTVTLFCGVFSAFSFLL